MQNAHLLLLDSCSIVNLYASTYFEALILSLGLDACISDYVLRESQFVRNAPAGGEQEKEPIRLDPFIQGGVLRVLELESEWEFEQFLSLALRLDDGEAATLSIAASRQGVVVTDDRKALSIAEELSVSTLTTPDVLLNWSERSHPAPHELRAVLENIRFRARYEPGRRHPLSAWWQSAIESRDLA